MPNETIEPDVLEDAADVALEEGTEEGIDRLGEVAAAAGDAGAAGASRARGCALAEQSGERSRHLASAAGARGRREFELTPRLIEAILEAGHFRPDTSTNGRLVLSLRGCALVGDAASVVDADKVRLRAVRPDHESFRCLIGVFNSDTRKISLYLGSTVPRRTGMLKFYNRENFGASGQNCNMLPTGCYELCVGTHGGSAGPVPFVLRLGDGPTSADAGPATVLRTTNDLTYGTRDVWDKTVPADNVHPAFLATSFSSLGCLTVRGWQQPGGAASTARGEWKAFRRKLGFDEANHGKRFDNLLVTGHEAAALAAGASELETLRQGSRGPKVLRLQQRLGLDGPDGKFGANTAFAFARLQHGEAGICDRDPVGADGGAARAAVRGGSRPAPIA